MVRKDEVGGEVDSGGCWTTRRGTDSWSVEVSRRGGSPRRTGLASARHPRTSWWSLSDGQGQIRKSKCSPGRGSPWGTRRGTKRGSSVGVGRGRSGEGAEQGRRALEI